MPSARLPPTTGGVPLNDRTHSPDAPSALAVGLAADTIVPAPAPFRPTTWNAPASGTTARSNVTVIDVTMLRWAAPLLTCAACTTAGAATSDRATASP